MPILQKGIGCHQHEQSAADFCAGADLRGKFLVAFRNNHLREAVFGTWLDMHILAHVFVDPTQELIDCRLRPSIGSLDIAIE